MNSHIQVGYVCDKNKGHVVLYGMEDACQSHAVAPIVILAPSSSSINMRGVADDMARWLADLERDAALWRYQQLEKDMGLDGN